MKHFSNIVYVTEPVASQDAALARAVALAQNHQARLTVLEVVPEITSGIGMPADGPSSADLAERIIQQRQQSLDALLEPHRKQLKIHSEILVGKLFLQVIQRVLNDEVDLVIKPAENPDFINRLFASDDMHLLRKCPCPVWIMKPNEKSNYQRIMAAIDFDINDDNADNGTKPEGRYGGYGNRGSRWYSRAYYRQYCRGNSRSVTMFSAGYKTTGI